MEYKRSSALFAEAQKVIPGGVNSPVRAFKGVGGTPIFIKEAKGAYLTDEDDNQFIDYINSWGPMILGHAYEPVVNAVVEKAKKGTSFGTPTALETDIAALAVSMVPNIDMIRFVNSGTEACMSAIRLARGYTGIDKIVKVTKGAAIATKIIMYQNMREWSAVLTEYAKLTSQYALEANPMGVFTNNYGNNESIFSIYNTANTNPGVNGALASQYNRRNLIAISPIIWRDAEWLVDDKRRLETEVVDNAVFTRKYKDVTNYADGSPLFRFAEMVLAAAEANARLGNNSAALTLLNSVRNRALANPSTQAYTSSSFASSADLVKAILKERRIEFICEGKRWGDIHRLLNDDIAPTTGIPRKVANGFPPVGSYTLGTPFSGTLSAAIPATDRRFLWPIPLTETNNNPVLKAQQNPGWE